MQAKLEESVMEPKQVLAADEIDLADRDFWARPPEEREGAFQTLRREYFNMAMLQ